MSSLSQFLLRLGWRHLQVALAVCLIENGVSIVFFFNRRGRLSLVSVPSPSFPISNHRAIVAGVTLTAFGHFRIWLHNQRDPSLVSCIDFMLVLYSQSPPAKEVLLHCIGCHRALVGRCVSPGMSKDYNEERALLGGACVG